MATVTQCSGNPSAAQFWGSILDNKGHRLAADYLLRELRRDCRGAKVTPAVADIVRELHDRAFVAVATDNMECFVHAIPRVLTDDLCIDELIVSSSVGSLKKESPERFFGPTLERHGLTPADAVLIDDCAETCQIFRDWGGSAHHYTDPGRLRDDLAQLLAPPANSLSNTW